LRTKEISMARTGSTATATALFCSLVALLVSGVDNVAHGFADVKPTGSTLLHWGGAAAVELGVLALGLALSEASRHGRRLRRLQLGLVLFVGASIFANLDASLAALLNQPVTVSALRTLDGWVTAKAVVLGALIPVLILAVLDALAMVMASHQTAPSALTDRSGPRLSTHPLSPPVDRSSTLLEAVTANPSVSASALARRLNVSRSTIYRWCESFGILRIDGQWSLPQEVAHFGSVNGKNGSLPDVTS
jgi:hypothetical protein